MKKSRIIFYRNSNRFCFILKLLHRLNLINLIKSFKSRKASEIGQMQVYLIRWNTIIFLKDSDRKPLQFRKLLPNWNVSICYFLIRTISDSRGVSREIFQVFKFILCFVWLEQKAPRKNFCRFFMSISWQFNVLERDEIQHGGNQSRSITQSLPFTVLNNCCSALNTAIKIWQIWHHW